MGQFLGTNNQGSICPSAPERSAKPKLPYMLPDGVYSGATTAAWSMESPHGWLARAAGPQDRARRAGSYAPNSWLRPLAFQDHEMEQARFSKERFWREGDVDSPSLTPAFTDGSFLWHGLMPSTAVGMGPVGPRAEDPPPNNLVAGALSEAPWWGMTTLAMPRHGSRPARLPLNHPPAAPLPGAINVAFFEGHIETVKLDRLWQLAWHRDYRAPASRPGLK